MERRYSDDEYYFAINKYILPLITKQPKIEDPNITQEELLVYLLYEENYLSHFIFPMIYMYNSTLNYSIVYEQLASAGKAVLSLIREIVWPKNDISNSQKLSKIDSISFYPTFLCEAQYNVMWQHPLALDDEQLTKVYNTKLYYTRRDLNGSRLLKPTICCSKEELIIKLFNITDYFRHSGITYAIGGGMSLYLNAYFEASYDIDIVLPNEVSTVDLEPIMDSICRYENFRVVEKFNKYICLINEIDGIGIDVEIGQHYKYPIVFSEDQYSDIDINGKTISVLTAKEVLWRKLQYGRLKDINNVIKFCKQTLGGTDYETTIADVFRKFESTIP